MSSANPTSAPRLSRQTLWLMSAACGISVANICYNQPLLGDFAAYFHATPAQVGWVAMASQAGYGLGLLFFLPLGDIRERTRLVMTLILLCATFLAATALAPTLGLLIAGNLLIGATAMSAQVLIPFAVELSPASHRSQTVGVMMTGVLGGILVGRTVGGILVGRTVGGILGEYLGWRAVFGIAAGAMVLLALALRGRLPHRQPTVQMSYGQLLASLGQVLKTQPRLWRPSLVTALSFGSFTAFWTSLSFLMSEQFHRGATETGMFGLVGLVGALAATYAGKLADKRGATFTVTVSLVLTILSFLLMEAWVAIPAIVIGVLLMDVGVQTVQVAEQGNVLALLPEARSRLNTLYMVARFIGGALGSLAGAYAWSLGRWPAVCAITIGLNVAALVIHFALRPRKAAVLAPVVEFSEAA